MAGKAGTTQTMYSPSPTTQNKKRPRIFNDINGIHPDEEPCRRVHFRKSFQDGSVMISCMPSRNEVNQLTVTREWSTPKIHEAMELCPFMPALSSGRNEVVFGKKLLLLCEVRNKCYSFYFHFNGTDYR